MSRDPSIQSKHRRRANAVLDRCYQSWYYLLTRIRRGGFVFITWAGDHGPHHEHVYRDGAFALKWDLENGQVMQGKASRRLLRIIVELENEGEL